MKVKELKEMLKDFNDNEELYFVESHPEQGEIIEKANVRVYFVPTKDYTKTFVDMMDYGRYTSTVEVEYIYGYDTADRHRLVIKVSKDYK